MLRASSSLAIAAPNVLQLAIVREVGVAGWLVTGRRRGALRPPLPGTSFPKTSDLPHRCLFLDAG